MSYTGLGSGFWARFGSEKKIFFGRKKFFFVFWDVLYSYFCVFPEKVSSSFFTFGKIPVCLMFFRVFAMSLIGSIMSYTGIGSGFWARFVSEKIFLFGRKKISFLFFRIFWAVFSVFFQEIAHRRFFFFGPKARPSYGRVPSRGGGW